MVLIQIQSIVHTNDQVLPPKRTILPPTIVTPDKHKTYYQRLM